MEQQQQQQQQPQSKQQQRGPRSSVMIALHDFQPQQSGQLPLVQGRMYTLHMSHKDGWAHVTDTHNQSGLAPAAYFKEAALVAAENLPCFVGQASIDVLSSILKKKNVGTYCLRERRRKRGTLCLLFKTKGKKVEELEIRTCTKGFALAGDTVPRKTIQELLDFYLAHQVKDGWGKLKRPLTNKDLQKALEKQTGRSPRTSSPKRTAKAAAAATVAQPQPQQPPTTTTATATSTFSDEERQCLQAHVHHSLDFIAKLPKSFQYSDQQKQVIATLKEVEAKMQTNQLIPADVLSFISDLDVSRVFKRASQSSKLGTTHKPATTASAGVPSRPSRPAPPPPQRKGSLATRPAPPPPSSASAATASATAAESAALTTTPPQAPTSPHHNRKPAGAVVRQGSPLKQTVQVSPPPSPTQPVPAPVLSVVAPVATTAPSAELPPPLPTPFADVENVLRNLKSEVIQQIRDENDISYNQSRGALLSVLDILWSHVDDAQVLSRVGGVMAAPDSPIVGGQDEITLTELFERISGYAEDAQQRGWAIDDDTAEIHQCLHQFRRLVDDANPTVVMRLVRQWLTPGRTGQYEIVEILSVFYQMETRVDLRLEMLLLLIALIKLDMDVIPILQLTVLPSELARDIMDSSTTDKDLQPKIQASLELFALIYSQGHNALSSQNAAYLQETFLPHLLSMSCGAVATQAEQAICDAAIVALLALNKQVVKPATGSHALVKAISEHDVRAISHKLLMFMNRGEDPVAALLGVEPDCELQPAEHSVMKLLQDVFSDASSGDRFAYEADLLLLVDIVLRELRDREITDPGLYQFLRLLHQIVSNTNGWKSMYGQVKDGVGSLSAKEHVPYSVKPQLEKISACLEAKQ
ncbi:hypothetical protein PTSG_01339 [Salpingoeca rosetta]|uniref:SH3 domain-containing protein n=1 Tax=Salpingoeca rosetta (strain ATCC 50818 / BSB-021) TaxID=946362 RepID=F2U023_SALR5|nr:uncharacterized protein PTSG_01339 [Salpingoeca rosetta]EGD80751.1 hypothetical protein PTSG_01339 [Salpingoeca rosetta]|eukprot:XP_004997312.1 hypothetical protein PTSG_01339 [Salpingoeca rosetta]